MDCSACSKRSCSAGGCQQVEEEDSLVCVLLDEVESLTRARSAAVSGSEPADAIRAVNALLTQVCPPLRQLTMATSAAIPHP